MTALTDKERAAALKMPIEEYYKLIQADDSHVVTKALDGQRAAADMDKEAYDVMLEGLNRGNPVGIGDQLYDEHNIETHWKEAPSSDEDKAIFYGYHVHSKDNPYGLHTHVRGGELGGHHKHGPQNRLGHHTHSVDITNLPTGMLIGRQSAVYIDGPHEHGSMAPDGGHNHRPQNFA